MSDIVIRAENLGKRYRIGQPVGYKTLRDSLANVFTAPLRRIRSAGGQPPESGHPSNTIWALKDVSFEVKQGEAVGIIGRNGSGKSTLLKILSRITAPTEGTVEIQGRLASLLEVGTGFHPELTGRENIYLNGAVLGMKRTEIARKFDEIVAFAEVEKFLDTPVKRYSSGMYVRLAFAVAAHLEPEILVVDEVLAVGDTQFQKKCLGKMGDVAKGGRTVLFVSHNMAAVEKLCAQGILLSEGRIQSAGNMNQVVGSYLSANEGRKRAPDNVLARNSSGSLEIISVGPVDQEGKPLSMAQTGQDLILAIILRSSRQLPQLTVTIGINNLIDLRITVLHSAIAGFNLMLLPGINSVVCRIPRFPLPPNKYLVDVKIISDRDVEIWSPNLCQLAVEGGDFYNTGKISDPSWGGYCYLEQKWEVQNGRK